MEKSIWKIRVDFHNKSHETVAVIEIPKNEYLGTETIADVVYPKMMEKIQELGWEGFGLWAKHEPIYKQTTLDEINYQRSADGSIVLDCEDHNCQWRAITTPLVTNNECVICCVDLNSNNRSYPLCFHSCVCKDCFKSLEKCPICRKPFKSKQQKTLV